MNSAYSASSTSSENEIVFTGDMLTIRKRVISKNEYVCCDICTNRYKLDKFILETDDNYVCYSCYFNIKYKNNENFDSLINNDKITIYQYIHKFMDTHEEKFCKIKKCLLCDVKNNIVIRKLKKGKKIYGDIYDNITDQKILYKESLKIESLLKNKN